MGERLMQALPYILLFAATAWLWSVADAIEYDPRPGNLGPGFWPKTALAMIGALSALQIGRALLTGANTDAKGVADRLEDDAAEDEAPRKLHLLLLGIALTFAYALSLDTIGFPIATTAFMVAFMYLGGSRRHVAIWASSLIGVVTTTVLLLKVVYISLPRGVPPFDGVTDLITGF
ncbi:MAG: tripartite tricarboxylate transporter TctB family protein [Ancylobacter novellus]|uniref:Tripartite tricarboxylate transporter TctB family protein n=1 Tax=Ancylobacter novellus TaxID=921 RepID=A0A2W5KMF1_ANCNO|nr:MAG: tripartite tricarboxylate transporter TctB family protein [Ancylobacter novellus]